MTILENIILESVELDKYENKLDFSAVLAAGCGAVLACGGCVIEPE